MAVPNYYTALGVQRTDSEATIKKAYRALAKQYHPDLNPGDGAAEKKMREISEAWETLGDANKRKAYDRELEGRRKKSPFGAGPSTAPHSGRPMTQEDFFHMSRSFDDMLSEEAIKNAARQSKAPRQKPVGTDDFFKHVIGFNGSKKK